MRGVSCRGRTAVRVSSPRLSDPSFLCCPRPVDATAWTWQAVCTSRACPRCHSHQRAGCSAGVSSGWRRACRSLESWREGHGQGWSFAESEGACGSHHPQSWADKRQKCPCREVKISIPGWDTGRWAPPRGLALTFSCGSLTLERPFLVAWGWWLCSALSLGGWASGF